MKPLQAIVIIVLLLLMLAACIGQANTVATCHEQHGRVVKNLWDVYECVEKGEH